MRKLSDHLIGSFPSLVQLGERLATTDLSKKVTNHMRHPFSHVTFDPHLDINLVSKSIAKAETEILIAMLFTTQPPLLICQTCAILLLTKCTLNQNSSNTKGTFLKNCRFIKSLGGRFTFNLLATCIF